VEKIVVGFIGASNSGNVIRWKAFQWIKYWTGGNNLTWNTGLGQRSIQIIDDCMVVKTKVNSVG